MINLTQFAMVNLTEFAIVNLTQLAMIADFKKWLRSINGTTVDLWKFQNAAMLKTKIK